MKARSPGSGPVPRARAWGEDGRGSGRMHAARRKGGNPAVILGVIGGVAAIVLLAVLFAGKSDRKRRDAHKRGADVADAGSTANVPQPQPPPPAPAPTPIPKEFRRDAEKPGDEWAVDPATKRVGVKKPRESSGTASDPMGLVAGGESAGWSANVGSPGMGGGNVVDLLRRGGEDRDKLMNDLRARKSSSVPDLIRQLDTEDRLAGIALVKALNELTGAGIDVPRVSEYNGSAMKKRWEEWVGANADKLK
jgi:hypothetical protein